MFIVQQKREETKVVETDNRQEEEKCLNIVLKIDIYIYIYVCMYLYI